MFCSVPVPSSVQWLHQLSHFPSQECDIYPCVTATAALYLLVVLASDGYVGCFPAFIALT